MQASSIRKGMIISYQGIPHRVMEFQHRTPGNLRAFVQVRLRNLQSGASIDVRFSATESVERIVLDVQEMEYLYSDGTFHHFMNVETFEQIALGDEALGDAVDYLTPGLTIQIQFFDGQPIGVELPSTVDLTVVQTEPEIKGATASNSPKPARLETGLTIQVPPFIKEGDRVRVSTSEGTYVERA
ncbi:MAG TPA: elongation factor P [Acidobacteriota bacterium]|nr:elongation factor P [Acidobacteriota bacterium]